MRRGEQPSAALFRAFGPPPLQGRRTGIQGRPAEPSALEAEDTATISQEGKPGNVAPGEIAEHVHSATCCTLGGPRDQRKRPDCFRLQVTRPGLATQA